MVGNQGGVLIKSESRKKKRWRNKEEKEQGEQKVRKKIRLIFWNVAGIGNKDEEFWKYIKNYDIVNLSETWAETKNWKRIEKWLLKEYRWEMQGATKDKRRGRSAGGMLQVSEKH